MNLIDPIRTETLTARLTEAYFSDPTRMLTLEPGEMLGSRGDDNRRLFLVKSGRMRGLLSNDEGTRNETFIFDRGDFVGIHSFFSRGFQMAFTVIADVTTTLAYIDREQPPKQINGSTNIDEQFMPIVVEGLMRRQLQLHKMAEKQKQVMNKLREVEKLASLGQLAAGVAHELNNALTVLSLGSRWVSEFLEHEIADRGSMEVLFFQSGLEGGRKLSTGEIRDREKIFARDLKLPGTAAGKLARTGIAADALKAFPKSALKRADALHNLWELGATLHDMCLGSSQAVHVISSMKTLGATNSEREPDVDVNNSIQIALSLTRANHKEIQLNLEFGELPPLVANLGELVQIWTNLIRNACEALTGANITQPVITVTSTFVREEGMVVVEVADNGPGIPEDLLPHIFQPNVTTRKRGLSFGLGLGLTIVKRLVTDYHGTVEILSTPNGATLRVQLPVKEHHGSA